MFSMISMFNMHVHACVYACACVYALAIPTHPYPLPPPFTHLPPRQGGGPPKSVKIQ